MAYECLCRREEQHLDYFPVYHKAALHTRTFLLGIRDCVFKGYDVSFCMINRAIELLMVCLDSSFGGANVPGRVV